MVPKILRPAWGQSPGFKIQRPSVGRPSVQEQDAFIKSRQTKDDRDREESNRVSDLQTEKAEV